MIKFKCKRCKATIKAPDSTVGKNVQCPSCGMKHVVPRQPPKVKKPIPPVVWVAVGLILFVMAAWAVWPSSGSSADANAEEDKGPKEEIPDFDAEHEKRMERERFEIDRDVEDRSRYARDAVEKRRKEAIEMQKQRELLERKQREAYEAEQREKERRNKRPDPDKNRYE